MTSVDPGLVHPRAQQGVEDRAERLVGPVPRDGADPQDVRFPAHAGERGAQQAVVDAVGDGVGGRADAA